MSKVSPVPPPVIRPTSRPSAPLPFSVSARLSIVALSVFGRNPSIPSRKPVSCNKSNELVDGILIGGALNSTFIRLTGHCQVVAAYNTYASQHRIALSDNEPAPKDDFSPCAPATRASALSSTSKRPLPFSFPDISLQFGLLRMVTDNALLAVVARPSLCCAAVANSLTRPQTTYTLRQFTFYP